MCSDSYHENKTAMYLFFVSLLANITQDKKKPIRSTNPSYLDKRLRTHLDNWSNKNETNPKKLRSEKSRKRENIVSGSIFQVSAKLKTSISNTIIQLFSFEKKDQEFFIQTVAEYMIANYDFFHCN